MVAIKSSTFVVFLDPENLAVHVLKVLFSLRGYKLFISCANWFSVMVMLFCELMVEFIASEKEVEFERFPFFRAIFIYVEFLLDKLIFLFETILRWYHESINFENFLFCSFANKSFGIPEYFWLSVMIK